MSTVNTNRCPDCDSIEGARRHRPGLLTNPASSRNNETAGPQGTAFTTERPEGCLATGADCLGAVNLGRPTISSLASVPDPLLANCCLNQNTSPLSERRLFRSQRWHASATNTVQSCSMRGRAFLVPEARASNV